MATLVLGGAGALIGSAFGGPAGARLGFAVGSMIGGWVEQRNLPRGEIGRLSDRRFSGSSYGSNIPFGFGEFRIGGSVIWVATDASGNHLIEHSKSSGGGGKGGGGKPKTKTYWYSATWAVQLCAGTLMASDGTLIDLNVSLRKMWANDQLVYDSEDANSLFKADDDFFFYRGTETQNPDPLIVAEKGVGSANVWACRGFAYIVFNDINLQPYGNQIFNLSVLVETDLGLETITVASPLSCLYRLVGIDPSEYDLSQATQEIRGVLIGERLSPADVAPPLCDFYGLDLAEYDGKLQHRPQGGASVATVAVSEMGFMAGTPDGNRLTRSRKLQSELPGRVEVQYYDTGSNHQQGVQSDAIQTADVQNVQSVAMPIAAAASEAKAYSSKRLDAIWAGSESLKTTLSLKYLWLAPADPITIVTELGAKRVKITEIVCSTSSEIEIECVAEDADAVDQPGGGSTGGTGGQEAVEPVPTDFVAWSGREIEDDDQASAGFYVAATGGDGWRGATIYYSPDNGTTWIEAGSINGRSVFGEAASTLSDSGATADEFDESNEVDVDISASGGLLSNATIDEVLAGINHALLGSEILGYREAELTGSNAYTLKKLRRGERGTPMDGHATGELFVNLTDSVVRVPVSETLVGETVKVKCVSPYQTIGDVASIDVVIAPRTPTDVETLKASVLVPREITPIEAASYDGSGSLRTPVAWTAIGSGVAAAIPSGAKMVTVYGQGDDGGDTTTRMKIWVRRESGAPEIPVCEAKINGSDEDAHASGHTMITLDADGYFEYKVDTGFRNGWSLFITHVWEPPS